MKNIMWLIPVIALPWSLATVVASYKDYKKRQADAKSPGQRAVVKAQSVMWFAFSMMFLTGGIFSMLAMKNVDRGTVEAVGYVAIGWVVVGFIASGVSGWIRGGLR